MYISGGNIKDIVGNVDGRDLWSTIAYNLPSSRNQFLINYDQILDGAALRMGDYKLVYSKYQSVILLNKKLYLIFLNEKVHLIALIKFRSV